MMVLVLVGVSIIVPQVSPHPPPAAIKIRVSISWSFPVVQGMSFSLRSSPLSHGGAIPGWFLLLLPQLEKVLQRQVDPPLRLLHLSDVDVQVQGGGLRGGRGGKTGEILRDVIVGQRGPLLVIRLRPALDQEDLRVGLDDGAVRVTTGETS